MKQQGNNTPSEANSTNKDVNNSKEDKLSNIEFQKIIARIINEHKEETQKLVSDLKDNMRQQLKKLKQYK
jgi:hypothetical protein